jgi:hypothetical protein
MADPATPNAHSPPILDRHDLGCPMSLTLLTSRVGAVQVP